MDPSILVVEDKAIIALDIMRFLISKGYKKTKYFLSGEDAIKAIGNEKPDLVILDIILHGKVTGIDIAEDLKKLSIPFIFISALSNPDHQKAVSKLKPAAVFIKPVNLNEVLIKVQNIFNPKKTKKINTSSLLN